MQSIDFSRWVCPFLFQAEDGIRDLVRSRGLGDVYKRQLAFRLERLSRHAGYWQNNCATTAACICASKRASPVSYTHLTLPTSDLV